MGCSDQFSNVGRRREQDHPAAPGSPCKSAFVLLADRRPDCRRAEDPVLLYTEPGVQEALHGSQMQTRLSKNGSGIRAFLRVVDASRGEVKRVEPCLFVCRRESKALRMNVAFLPPLA